MLKSESQNDFPQKLRRVGEAIDPETAYRHDNGLRDNGPNETSEWSLVWVRWIREAFPAASLSISYALGLHHFCLALNNHSHRPVSLSNSTNTTSSTCGMHPSSRVFHLLLGWTRAKCQRDSLIVRSGATIFANPVTTLNFSRRVVALIPLLFWFCSVLLALHLPIECVQEPLRQHVGHGRRLTMTCAFFSEPKSCGVPIHHPKVLNRAHVFYCCK